MSERDKPSQADVSSVRIAASERVSSVDPRAHAAWRTWLAALADDADAATAAAIAYESLEGEGRDAWLDALDADADEVGVPVIALYAPLLAVEQDEPRRARIASHVAGAPRKSTPPRAFVGGPPHGERACVIASPLYLSFVEILLCRYHPDRGVREARHTWLAHERDIEGVSNEAGVSLAPAALADVVEDLAHAVVADRRAGRAAPPALAHYAELFGLELAPASGRG